MGFVSHAEHETQRFRRQQRGKIYKNPWFCSPWKANRQLEPLPMYSLAQPAIQQHKYTLKASWRHQNQTDISRLRCLLTSLWGCRYRANSRHGAWRQNCRWTQEKKINWKETFHQVIFFDNEWFLPTGCKRSVSLFQHPPCWGETSDGSVAVSATAAKFQVREPKQNQLIAPWWLATVKVITEVWDIIRTKHSVSITLLCL